MVFLEGDDSPNAPKCPHCGWSFRIESWNTEYNEPCSWAEGFCLKCDKKFDINTWTEVHITTSK